MRIAVLDIGGTSIKSAIWTEQGLEDIREQDTNAGLGGVHVMEEAKRILHSYDDFQAIGVSSAGQVNSVEGYIRYANENIPGYTGMRIKDILESEFGVPVAVENDVNAAALGEGIFGAGKDYEDFLCITYGTGVGGAVVIGKEVYKGCAFSAAEFGGIVVHPEDVKVGEPFSGGYEKYASTTALVQRAGAFDLSLTDGRKIFARIEEPEIQAIVDGWIDEIAHGLVSLIHIFNPPCIVLGGGVMAQPYILELIKEKTYKRIMRSFGDVQLVQAELGNRAGLMGAAYLGRKAAMLHTPQ